MCSYTAKPQCITMHSPLSSPPQPHTANDDHDSDENNYYIDVHDRSSILLVLPPPKTMDQILSKAVTSMYTVRDIDNYEDNTLAKTDTAQKHSAIEPHSSISIHKQILRIAAAIQKMVLPLLPTCKGSRKREYIENGMINVKGDTEHIATRSHYIFSLTGFPWLIEKMEIAGGIAKQIHDLEQQLHKCKLNGKQLGAGAVKPDLKELLMQLVGFTTSL
ncbi:hypothetical protein BDD12DRAFT_810713 [Trichophaea hybrida]|nr:hypothetical protein BDD12DRAFT_810713 [Trichophaea hybrida]